MVNKLSKSEIKKKVDFFFSNLEGKTPEDVKKIKRLAMSQKIPLGKNKKLFCKRCLAPYVKSKIRIKNKTKTVTCQNCGAVSRWNLN